MIRVQHENLKSFRRYQSKRRHTQNFIQPSYLLIRAWNGEMSWRSLADRELVEHSLEQRQSTPIIPVSISV